MAGQLEINRHTLFHLSLITLLGMPALGFLLITFAHDKGIVDTLLERAVDLKHAGSLVEHLLGIGIGLAYGLLAALLGIVLINRPNMQSVNEFFSDLIRKINPGLKEILFYSFCAGVGEEILFRGAIQPLIGIWPASVIFVLLHGYINFDNFRTTVYGAFLVVVSGGFGYLDNAFGIASPMAAHFIYDVVMFLHLRKLKNRQEVDSTVSTEEEIRLD